MANTTPKSILILDDDRSLARALELEFQDHGYTVTTAETIAGIPPLVFDYAILDVRLVGEFGIQAIEQLKAKSPDCRIVVLSGYGSVATAVDAVKRGALNYLVKPASFLQLENALLERKEDTLPGLKVPSLSQVENEYIDYVLLKNEGNISKSAKELGIHRQSLQRKLKKYS